MKYRISNRKMANHKKGKNATHTNPPIIFHSLPEALIHAVETIEERHKNHAARFGKINSVEIYEICYLARTSDPKYLHVKFCDFDEGKYKETTFENMTLCDIIRSHNKSRYFIRCHDNYVINMQMVKRINFRDNKITMRYPQEDGSYPTIDIGVNYRRQMKYRRVKTT